MADELSLKDIAPWLRETDIDRSISYFEGQTENAELNLRLTKQVAASIFRAVTAGTLRASLFAAGRFKDLPPDAFGSVDEVESYIISGEFGIDPLWPDEWWIWENKDWAFPESTFTKWMNSRDFLNSTTFPERVDPLIASQRRLSSRDPSQNIRVTFSEAISWIAFGIALPADRLLKAIRSESFTGQTIISSQETLVEAASRLIDAGKGSSLRIYGCHIDHRDQQGGDYDLIPSLRLEKYRGFVIGRDDLLYGRGSLRNFVHANSSHVVGSQKRDLFAEVLVNREDLINSFPERTSEKGSSGAPVRTGDPGRPEKGRTRYMEEHARRLESGEAHVQVTQEAKILRSWYAENFPTDPISTAKNIENAIRSNHRKGRPNAQN